MKGDWELSVIAHYEHAVGVEANVGLKGFVQHYFNSVPEASRRLINRYRKIKGNAAKDLARLTEQDLKKP